MGPRVVAVPSSRDSHDARTRDMGLLNIIRRIHQRQKLPIREMSRLTGMSRKTVSKHLAAWILGAALQAERG